MPGSTKRKLAIAAGSLGAVLALSACGLWALQAPTLAVPAQQDMVISNITVFNPGVGRTEKQTIVIRSGKIAEVRAARADDPPPICPDCIAMPGLIDAHVHNAPKLAFGNQELFSLLYVAHGVTTVRDVGQTDDSIGALVERANSGKIVAPNMLWCGQVLESNPLSFGAARSVETGSEATNAVNALAAEGVDCIKVYNNLAPEPYAAIRVAAAVHGLPVIGHVPHRVGLAKVSDFESQHFTGIPYFKGGETPQHSDFRDTDWMALDEASIREALQYAKRANVSFLPTLFNGRIRLAASDPKRFPPTKGAALVPQIWEKAWNSPTQVASHPSESEIAPRLARLKILWDVTRMAREEGVEILAGTDAMMPWVVPGESLHREIEEIAGALGDNEAALASATLINGRHLANGAIGEIAVGKRADILLLKQDPAADLAALGRWSHVYVNGRHYTRAEIDAFMARFQRHFRSDYYNFVMGFLADIVGSGKGRTTMKDEH